VERERLVFGTRIWLNRHHGEGDRCRFFEADGSMLHRCRLQGYDLHLRDMVSMLPSRLPN